MKEKMKPMLIGGSIGVATGVGAAFLMGKKDTKNLIIFGIIGLAAGAAVGFFMSKDEQKSNAKGVTKQRYSTHNDQVNCPEGCDKIWVNDSKVPANSHWACDCGSKGVKPASFS